MYGPPCTYLVLLHHGSAEDSAEHGQSVLPLPVVQTADRHMCDAGIMVTLHQPSETHNKTQTASLSSLSIL